MRGIGGIREAYLPLAWFLAPQDVLRPFTSAWCLAGEKYYVKPAYKVGGFSADAQMLGVTGDFILVKNLMLDGKSLMDFRVGSATIHRT